MIIQPQGIVRIMKGVGWDSSYRHVRWFANSAAQNAYMASHLAFSVENSTYVRQTGAVAVPGSADQYYDCNYLSFQNIGFSNKTFYAFIVGVEYVNPDTTYLYIQIDYVQTWLFQFTMGKCFVEREHVSNDAIGAHTVPENLPFGELITQGKSDYRQTPVGVLVYEKPGTVETSFENGIYNPLETLATDSAGTLWTALLPLSDEPEKIAMLRMGFAEKTDTLTYTRVTASFTWGDDSYTPVNNKLYVFPYCVLTVDDYGANSENFHPEDFDSKSSFSFSLENKNSPYPMSVLVPLDYKNNSAARQYAMVKTDFPDCPYIIDNFRAWISSVGAKQQIAEQNQIAQTVLQDIGAGVSSLTSGVQQAVSGNALGAGNNVIGAALGGVGRHLNLEAMQKSNAVDREYAYTHGFSVGGQFGGNLAMWISGDRGWRITYNVIKPEYARILDEYFTRFGYRVARYKKPNLTSRNTFNYVKTVDASVSGNVPDEARTLIEQIFNSGVTLWHTDSIENYSVENGINPAALSENADE